jgi:hypothetical protein
MKKIKNYTGTDSGNPDRPEIEHFGNCDVCGALVDMRNLAQVTAHMHGREPLDFTGQPDPTCNRSARSARYTALNKSKNPGNDQTENASQRKVTHACLTGRHLVAAPAEQTSAAGWGRATPGGRLENPSQRRTLTIRLRRRMSKQLKAAHTAAFFVSVSRAKRSLVTPISLGQQTQPQCLV